MNCNPFGVKMPTTTSIADSTEARAASSSVSSTSKFVLRPSSLSAQTINFDKKDECGNEATTSKSSEESESGNSCTSNIQQTGNNSSEISQSETCRPSQRSSTPPAEESNPAEAVTHSADDSSSLTSTQSNSPSAVAKPHRNDVHGAVSSSTDESTSSAAKAFRPASSDGFVFGQNIHKRVVNVDEESCSSITSNDTAELSFAHAGSSNQSEDAEKSANHDKAKSLTESAKEYELRQVKRTYDEVQVITGEEDEINIRQLNCKLYTFDKTLSSWQERGRGMLRLNDKESTDSYGCIQSRLVMRTQGSLRLILNCKIWPAMSVEKASPKSIQLSAMDADGGIKIYLIQTNSNDADQLYSALQYRVRALKSRVNNEETDTNTASSSHQPGDDVDSTTEVNDSSPTKKIRSEVSNEADQSSLTARTENTS